MLETVVVVALKVALVAEEGTVTEPGTVRVLLELVSVTSAPPAGAALFNVTVHVVDAFAPTLAGLQLSDETIATVTRLTRVFADVPL